MPYTQALDLIARESTALFDALHRHDGEQATQRWRTKPEIAVQYMAARLSPNEFDFDTWYATVGPPARWTAAPSTGRQPHGT